MSSAEKRKQWNIYFDASFYFSSFALTGLIYVKQIVPQITALWLLFSITNGHVSFSLYLMEYHFIIHKNMLNDSYFLQMVATVDIILTDPPLMPCDTNPTSSHATRLISLGFFHNIPRYAITAANQGYNINTSMGLHCRQYPNHYVELICCHISFLSIATCLIAITQPSKYHPGSHYLYIWKYIVTSAHSLSNGSRPAARTEIHIYICIYIARRHGHVFRMALHNEGDWRMETWQRARRASCHVSIRQSPSCVMPFWTHAKCLLAFISYPPMWIKTKYTFIKTVYSPRFYGGPYLQAKHADVCSGVLFWTACTRHPHVLSLPSSSLWMSLLLPFDCEELVCNVLECYSHSLWRYINIVNLNLNQCLPRSPTHICGTRGDMI